MNDLPHEWIAIGAAGLATFFLIFAGLRLFLPYWKNYRQNYVDGTAVTLDAMYVTMPAQHVFYLGVLFALVLGMLFGVMSRNLFVAMLMGVPGLFLPRIVLWILKRKRDALFNLQLIDALMNISNSLRAGFSLPQSLELIHQEMPAPISQEVRLVCQELRLGVNMDDALANLHRRMPLEDVDLMVTSISIVREVGGNLTEVFDNIAHTIRERYRIEGKVRALTAMGRAQAIVMCLMPFAIAFFMSILVPQMAAVIVNNPIGWVVIALVVILEILAVWWIFKIIQIRV